MSKYELSLARDYVPGWTVVDAVRELFQNAIDQETVVEDNEMSFMYHEDSKKLFISNKKSVLEIKTLLLGASTKTGDNRTIGQFGEGYKIATLVLTRLGKSVVIYNYGAKEVWRPRFVNSRRYGAEVLTFFVDKKFAWQSVPDDNLTIVVEGITKEEYAQILESNLHISPPHNFFKGSKGRILLEPKHAGKVFVNGLFVCDHKQLKHGYDFAPSALKIDRDRKLVADFDLFWETSMLWGDETSDENQEAMLAELITNGVVDVKYVTHRVNTVVANKIHSEFKEQYGPNAVPVSNQKEAEELSDKHKPVIVNDVHANIIKSSTEYEKPEVIERPSLSSRINEWIEKHGQGLSADAIDELVDICDEFN